jgi:hypothetical protein
MKLGLLSNSADLSRSDLRKKKLIEPKRLRRLRKRRPN